MLSNRPLAARVCQSQIGAEAASTGKLAIFTHTAPMACFCLVGPKEAQFGQFSSILVGRFPMLANAAQGLIAYRLWRVLGISGNCERNTGINQASGLAVST